MGKFGEKSRARIRSEGARAQRRTPTPSRPEEVVHSDILFLVKGTSRAKIDPDELDTAAVRSSLVVTLPKAPRLHCAGEEIYAVQVAEMILEPLACQLESPSNLQLFRRRLSGGSAGSWASIIVGTSTACLVPDTARVEAGG